MRNCRFPQLWRSLLSFRLAFSGVVLESCPKSLAPLLDAVRAAGEIGNPTLDGHFPPRKVACGYDLGILHLKDFIVIDMGGRGLYA